MYRNKLVCDNMHFSHNFFCFETINHASPGSCGHHMCMVHTSRGRGFNFFVIIYVKKGCQVPAPSPSAPFYGAQHIFIILPGKIISKSVHRFGTTAGVTVNFFVLYDVPIVLYYQLFRKQLLAILTFKNMELMDCGFRYL